MGVVTWCRWVCLVKCVCLYVCMGSGAHVDEDNSSQRTALHEAAEAERADITELLLRQSEVDPASRDDKDRTPYDIAYSKKNDEVWNGLVWA